MSRIFVQRKCGLSNDKDQEMLDLPIHRKERSESIVPKIKSVVRTSVRISFEASGTTKIANRALRTIASTSQKLLETSPAARRLSY